LVYRYGYRQPASPIWECQIKKNKIERVKIKKNKKRDKILILIFWENLGAWRWGLGESQAPKLLISSATVYDHMNYPSSIHLSNDIKLFNQNNWHEREAHGCLGKGV